MDASQFRGDCCVERRTSATQRPLDNKHVSRGGLLEDSLPTWKSRLLPEVILTTTAVSGGQCIVPSTFISGSAVKTAFLSFPPSVSGAVCVSLGLDFLFKIHHVTTLVCHHPRCRAHRRLHRLGGPLSGQLPCAVWTRVASPCSAHLSACHKERCPLPRQVRTAV